MKSCLGCFIVLVFLAQLDNVLASQDEEQVFPSPESLQPDVHFWTRVYTEISSSQGFIHDDRNLGIVYETVELKPKMSRRSRHRKVDKIKKRYRSILMKLAKGRRDNLTLQESRVLALWPEGTDNKTFRKAARQLRFQLGQSDRFKEGLQRSGKWLPYIKDTLKEIGVPEALAALPHVESSFNPSAYSFVGAAGMWQFTRSTGRRFMRIDHVVDERLDPYISTIAAARLLKYNFETTGTWPLAITSYNHGVSGMRRATKKLGGTDIVPILRHYDGRTFGFASRNFYVAFLAAVEVSRNAKKYFGEVLLLDAEETFTVTVPDYMSVKTFAKSVNVSKKMVKRRNPALRPSVYNDTKFIPKGFKMRLPATLDKSSVELALQSVPAQLRYARQKPDLEYRVRRGDTLSEIAERFGIGLSKLVASNNLSSRHRIRIGQKLRLPSNTKMPKTLAEFKADESGYYAVRKGDTVSLIADRFKVDKAQLLLANNISNPHAIYVGQKIKVNELSDLQTSSEKQVVASLDKSETNLQQTLAEEQADTDDDQGVSDEFKKQIAEIDGSVVALPEMAMPPSDQIDSAEPVSSEEVDMIAPVQPAGLHPALSADPSDYTVQANGRLIVQAAETLGHYAHWLDIPTQRLRNINRLKRHSEVVIGKQLKLDFSKVDKEAFENRRIAHHRDLQESFFSQYMITGTLEHKVKKGELIWSLSQLKYNVPIWLLRQHNPDLKFKKIRTGDKIVFPVVERKVKADNVNSVDVSQM